MVAWRLTAKKCRPTKFYITDYRDRGEWNELPIPSRPTYAVQYFRDDFVSGLWTLMVSNNIKDEVRLQVAVPVIVPLPDLKMELPSPFSNSLISFFILAIAILRIRNGAIQNLSFLSTRH
jgi:hypothetical protein